MIDLFPPPLILAADAREGGASVHQAHLMPFSIDYDGLAPIDRYLVQRPFDEEEDRAGPSAPVVADGAVSDRRTRRRCSAFRGRQIVGTPFDLPAGYSLALLQLDPHTQLLQRREASNGAGGKASRNDDVGAGPSAPSGLQEARGADELRRARFERLAPSEPPAHGEKRSNGGKAAVMAKFSLDSDEEDEEPPGEGDVDDSMDTFDGPAGGIAAEGNPASGISGVVDWDQEKDMPLSEDDAEEEPVRILRVAAQLGSDLLVWGADGPVDEGDDGVVRALREWVSLHQVIASA